MPHISALLIVICAAQISTATSTASAGQEYSYVTPSGLVHVMLHVPAGTVQRRWQGTEWQIIDVPAFLVDKYEVSFEQYRAYVMDTGADEPAYSDDERLNAPDQPVIGVSYQEAEAYCGWAGLRLPSADEWMRAAYGSDERPYPWGWDEPSEGLANFGRWDPEAWDLPAPYPDESDGWMWSAPVGALVDGASPFGALNMAGNVREWTTTWRTRDSQRLALGASWKWPPSVRNHLSGNIHSRQYEDLGFRCVGPESIGATQVDWSTWGHVKKAR